LGSGSCSGVTVGRSGLGRSLFPADPAVYAIGEVGDCRNPENRSGEDRYPVRELGIQLIAQHDGEAACQHQADQNEVDSVV